MALTGSNTSSLLGILEGAFGCIDSNTASTVSIDNIPVQKPTTPKTSTEEKPPQNMPTTLSGECSLATAELVFPFKSPSPVIAGIPESLVPLHGPETCSHYRCQYPSCDEELSQKAAACNHVCHDHLHVALACLYCSANNSPKMQWYSTSAWEHHTHKHAQDNLPIHPDDSGFYEQFGEADTLPLTSKLTSTLPPSINIHERARATKQFLEEGNDESTSPSQETQTLKLPTPKHHIKQGPIKLVISRTEHLVEL